MANFAIWSYDKKCRKQGQIDVSAILEWESLPGLVI